MFLIPCQVLFEGGPHDGFFAEWEYIPEDRVVVPADSQWRELACHDGESHGNRDRDCLAAIYVWRNTQIVGDQANPDILLRYRILTYHAKGSPSSNGSQPSRRLSLSRVWLQFRSWFKSSHPSSLDSKTPHGRQSPDVREQCGRKRES